MTFIEMNDACMHMLHASCTVITARDRRCLSGPRQDHQGGARVEGEAGGEGEDRDWREVRYGGGGEEGHQQTIEVWTGFYCNCTVI